MFDHPCRSPASAQERQGRVWPRSGAGYTSRMVDIYDQGKRSAIMAAVGRADTAPEMVVRRLAHGLGYRFRMHRRDLVGKPDIAFPKLRKLIFVHGCFWHRHAGCRHTSMPKTRVEFWSAKFDGNVRRDAAVIEALEADGWCCLVVWGCETRDIAALTGRLAAFLSTP